MPIGIDEAEFFDELDDVETGVEGETTPESQPALEPGVQVQEDTQDKDDFISSLLKSRGIEDKSKIKFENEDGEVEEVSWDSLNNKDKLTLLESSSGTPEEGLDDSEIQLINTIRNSGLTPEEYIKYVGNEEVTRYLKDNQQVHYDIDQFSDDDVFLMDLMSRMENITEDEAAEVLNRSKANEDLYKRQVEAIRNEYKEAEKENLNQAQLEQEQLQQQRFEEFSNKIVDEINNLTEIQGFDLNMEDSDMQSLYDFITGQDAAGNNYFSKALSDPKTLVKVAWLALNGDRMVSDITNYFQKEIANVRRESYKKGLGESQKVKDKGNTVVYNKKSKSEVYSDDLDDF